MRRHDTLPLFKLSSAAPGAGARRSTATRSTRTRPQPIPRSAPADGRPKAGSFDLALDRADGPVAPGSIPSLPSLMRDTMRLHFLVPTDGPDGPFTDDAFETFETLLLTAAGGYTRLPDVQGAWKAPDGRVIRDTSRSYVITVDRSEAESIALDIHNFIKSFFQQEAVLVESTPTTASMF